MHAAASIQPNLLVHEEERNPVANRVGNRAVLAHERGVQRKARQFLRGGEPKRLAGLWAAEEVEKGGVHELRIRCGIGGAGQDVSTPFPSATIAVEKGRGAAVESPDSDLASLLE